MCEPLLCSVKRAMEAASSENIPNTEETKTNALLRAAYEGNVSLVIKMIADGVPVDAANQGGLQAIHFAAKAGRVDVIDEILASGADVNAKSSRGNTPLHVASLLGQSEVVKLLLRRGANVNAIAKCNDNDFFMSLKSLSIELLFSQTLGAYFMCYGLNDVYNDEFSPLYMAAQVGHQEIVTLMLAHGADPTLTTANGCTPCDVALQQGFRAVSELLAEYEKRINDETVEIPSKENKENGMSEKMDDYACAAEAEDKMTPEVVIRRGNPSKTPRPKSGPPPVCLEAIPSPKPSPLRINDNKGLP